MPTFRQLMNHEEHRWSYMTSEQLLRRLRRITQPQKLRCFLTMAIRNNRTALQEAARERMAVLVGIDGRSSSSTPTRSGEFAAEWRRQAQGRIARGGPVPASGLLSEALSRSATDSPSPTSSPSSTTSRSIPTTSQRSTHSGPVIVSGRPTTFSANEIMGPLSIPKVKKKKPKKKAIRHIRFGKGGS